MRNNGVEEFLLGGYIFVIICFSISIILLLLLILS